MVASALAFLLLFCSHFLGSNPVDCCNSELRDSLQQLVDGWRAKQQGGAVAVAIVSPDGTDYLFSGQLSPNNPTLPNDHTLFEIGSITKGFTGFLLADQVLSGKVSLNDTLAELLTDCPGRQSSPAGNVTLLELATHSAGLPNMPEDLEVRILYTKKQLCTWFQTAVPLRRGTFAYSNPGMALLGLALAAKSRCSYESLLKERILTPLGLKDTTVTLTENQKLRLAPGHDNNGMPAPMFPFDAMTSAGGLLSSVSQLSLFLRFTTGLVTYGKPMNEILELATRHWANTPYTIYTLGLAWIRQLLPDNDLLVCHEGATIGYNSFIGWTPKRKVGIAVLVSVRVTTKEIVDDLALELLQLKL